MSELKGSDRVSIESSTHGIYQELSERSGQDPEKAPFYLMKDVFIWAVTIGVQSGNRRPLSGGRNQIFRWDQFSTDVDVPALMAIAVAETGDVEILDNESQILRIAEEYANSGIRKLKRELMDQPGQPLWNLLDLIRQDN
jgi:dnd system-associated protein 4